MSFLSRIKNIPNAVKASIAFFAANVVTSGISYLVTPVYTRLLSSEEFGQASLFLTWQQIFGIIAMFCLASGVFNIGMSDYPEKRNDYSFSMLILSNIITVVFFGILLSLYPLVSSFIKLDYPFIFLMFAICLVQPAYNFWVTRQRYEYKYKLVLLWSLICGIMSPLVAILLIAFSKEGDRLYPRIFGAECVLILIYVFFYVYIGIKNKWRLNIKYWKQAFLFNLPLIPHYLSSYLLSSSDKIMISHLVGDSQTAYYSLAQSIASIASIIWIAINGSLVPYTYEKCKENDFVSVSKVASPLVGIFAVGCIAIILIAPEMISFLGTEEYKQALIIIPPLVGGVFFQVHYFLYANIVYFYKKPVYVMVGSVVSFALNLVLNYFGIKIWGYQAAAYTTIICFLVQAIIDYFAMRIIVGKNVYDMVFVVMLSVVVVIFSLFGIYFYDSAVKRYFLIFLFLLALVIFRKRIIGFLSFRNKSKLEK